MIFQNKANEVKIKASYLSGGREVETFCLKNCDICMHREKKDKEEKDSSVTSLIKVCCTLRCDYMIKQYHL